MHLHIQIMPVGQLHQPRVVGLQGSGVDHDVVVVRVLVHDAVVAHPALLVADERILGLSDAQCLHVVGGVNLGQQHRVPASEHELAHVAGVEDGYAAPAGAVLFDDALGVLHGHQPAAELHHARPQIDVLVVQGCAQGRSRFSGFGGPLTGVVASADGLAFHGEFHLLFKTNKNGQEEASAPSVLSPARLASCLAPSVSPDGISPEAVPGHGLFA